MTIRSSRPRRHPTKRRAVFVVLALALPVLTGAVLDQPSPDRLGGSFDRSACTDPDPCDYVWEGASLAPFARADVQEVEFRSHDGTKLHGWLAFPDLPDGVTDAPVALHSSPYMGVCSRGAGGCVPTPADPSFWEDDPDPGVTRAWGVPPIELIRRGYVAAFFEVRGTGGSEGCIDWGGEDETRDQKALVDWLAAQRWSNGRVGMGGNSYPGTTPWQAAIQAPPGLKTIVTAGIVTDYYTFHHTPQGMQHAAYPTAIAELEASMAWLPHAGAGGDPVRELERISERAAPDTCPAFAPAREAAEGGFLRDRDPGFWEPRRYQDRLDQVRASVLMAHGLQDVTGHAFQDMLVWEALQGPGVRPRPPRSTCPSQAPRCADPPLSPPMWQISGQWRHGPPFSESPSLPADDDWSQVLFDWLGYWLQGVGEPPPHKVDYQDTTGAWRTTSAWPPAEAREEVLYLDGDQLTIGPGGDDRRFIAAPTSLGVRDYFQHAAGPWSPSCRQEHVPEALSADAVAYVSEPFAGDSLLAGNPFVYLELSSDQPGGLVEVALLRWPEGVSCTGAGVDLVVARGAADLSHHEGSYDRRPFPVGEPTRVRVDLFNNAVPFSPGDRLVLVVSGPDANGGLGPAASPYTPEITVHAGVSHAVVPFVFGGLGGDTSDIDYPPNPAAPEGGGS